MGSAAQIKRSAIIAHNGDEDAHALAFAKYDLMNLQGSPDFLNLWAVMWDDFPNILYTTGMVGSLGWSSSSQDTGAALAASAGGTGGANGSTGVLQLSTGIGTAAGAQVNLGKQQLYGHKAFIWEARVFLTDINNGTDDVSFNVGLHDNTVASAVATPTHGFYFLYSSADSSIHAVTTSDSTPDNQDTGFIPTADTWTRLRIVSDGGGNAYFYIDDMDTPKTSHTTANTIPDTTSADNYGQCLHVWKTAGTTSRSLMVDYVYFKIAR